MFCKKEVQIRTSWNNCVPLPSFSAAFVPQYDFGAPTPPSRDEVGVQYISRYPCPASFIEMVNTSFKILAYIDLRQSRDYFPALPFDTPPARILPRTSTRIDRRPNSRQSNRIVPTPVEPSSLLRPLSRIAVSLSLGEME